jgi:hypothetical protein
MPQLDDDESGVKTPESAVLTGIANLYRLVFVTVAIAIVWIVGVGVAIYYSWAAENGSFVQGCATNCLAA